MGQCCLNKSKKPAVYIQIGDIPRPQTENFTRETKSPTSQNQTSWANIQMTPYVRINSPVNNTNNISHTTLQDNNKIKKPKHNRKLSKIIEEETAKYLDMKKKFVKMSSEKILKINPPPKATHKRTKSTIIGIGTGIQPNTINKPKIKKLQTQLRAHSSSNLFDIPELNQKTSLKLISENIENINSGSNSFISKKQTYSTSHSYSYSYSYSYSQPDNDTSNIIVPKEPYIKKLDGNKIRRKSTSNMYDNITKNKHGSIASMLDPV